MSSDEIGSAVLATAGRLRVTAAFGDLTLGDILGGANLTLAVVNYQFGSKDGLIAEIFIILILQLSRKQQRDRTRWTMLRTIRHVRALTAIHLCNFIADKTRAGRPQRSSFIEGLHVALAGAGRERHQAIDKTVGNLLLLRFEIFENLFAAPHNPTNQRNSRSYSSRSIRRSSSTAC